MDLFPPPLQLSNEFSRFLNNRVKLWTRLLHAVTLTTTELLILTLPILIIVECSKNMSVTDDNNNNIRN